LANKDGSSQTSRSDRNVGLSFAGGSAGRAERASALKSQSTKGDPKTKPKMVRLRGKLKVGGV